MGAILKRASKRVECFGLEMHKSPFGYVPHLPAVPAGMIHRSKCFDTVDDAVLACANGFKPTIENDEEK